MIKISLLPLPILAIGLSVSCNKQIDVVPDSPEEIVFSTEYDISVFTKSDVTSLSTLNLVCTAGSSGKETEQWRIDGANVSGGFLATGKYWPMPSSYSAIGGLHFYAANTTLFTGAQGAYTDILDSKEGFDVVCASLANPVYAGSNNLICNHIFSKLGKTFVVPSASGYTISNLYVTCTNIPGKGVYHLWDGSWNVKAYYTWNVIYGNVGLTISDRFLIPGTCTFNVSYTATRDGYSYTVSPESPKSASVYFPAGKVCTLYLNIPVEESTNVDFTVSMSASSWESGVAYNETL